MQVLKFTEIKKMYQPRGLSPINFMKLITRLHTIIAHLFWLQENYCKIHHNSFSGPDQETRPWKSFKWSPKEYCFSTEKDKSECIKY